MRENPFSYTKIVKGKAFCNREQELRDLSNYINSSQNVVLYSNRRIGKSSLLHKAAEKMRKRRNFLYIDLYGTISETDFVASIFKGLDQIESNLEKVIILLKGSLKSLNLTISLDPKTASPTISPNFIPSQKSTLLEDAFSAILKLSKGRPLCVVFDEFQEVSFYSEPDFEKRLRSVIQTHDNISYIFSGSKRHILLRMFAENKQAFYRQAEPYELKSIAKKHYLKWINNIFEEKGTVLDENFINEILDVCKCHPMYVQRFLFHLWQESNISDQTVNYILDMLMQRHEGEFQILWDSLTLNQKKVIKLVKKRGGENIFYADAIQGVQLKTASQVKKAIDTLIEREIVYKNKTYHLTDLLFTYWLENQI